MRIPESNNEIQAKLMSGEGDSTEDSSVREVFFQACNLETREERTDFIKMACAGDERMVEEVESLLVAHEESNSLMELDLLGDLEGISNDMIGSSIGRYRILEKLGEGGFGEVFRVEQTEPIQRELALKIIKPGMDSKDVIRRFESERQALARLDHPNIARIVDAGTTDMGRPYFVMELACGEPITRHCDHHGLTIDERLNLFRQVCHGVMHAHQKGIVHRDLNPANIVITEQEGRLIPKIIDFGIAKSLQGHLTGKTVLTERQFLVGTPEYMSPEQFTVSSSELDSRSDIYTLGSVLYELVSGTTPVDSETIRSAGISEIPRILSEDEPEKPSTRLRTVNDTKSIAEKRGSTLSKLDHKVRGDLDRIIMKCLERDRIRRYESADELDQDLEAFLDYRPVQATAPSLAYRFRKYVRRNKQTIQSSTAVSAILVAFGAILFASQSRSFIPLNFDEVDKSIAVLPFEHRSINEEDLFFTEGIHNDLLTQISNIKGVKVIARTSVMEYRDTDKSLKTIAKELGVSFLIVGSVQRAEDKVRIHMQMIDPRDGTHVWAEDYTGQLNVANVFDVQTDIAGSIARRFEVEIVPSLENRINDWPTSSLEALEAYHRGLECKVREDLVSKKEAIAYFKKAISLDSNFALAHVKLAQTLRSLTFQHGYPKEIINPEVESHINLALQIDDTLSDAYVILGGLRKQQRDYSAAKEAADRAIELNPNSSMAYVLKADLVAFLTSSDNQGLVKEERLALLKKACELNPNAENQFNKLVDLLKEQGKYEEALEFIKKEVARKPDSASRLMQLGECHEYLDQFDGAIAAYRGAHSVDPHRPRMMSRLFLIYWYLGDLETADFWFKRYLLVQKEPRVWFVTKMWHAYLHGDQDARANYAEQALKSIPDFIWALRNVTEAYLSMDAPMKARKCWLKGYPELFEPGVIVDRKLLSHAVDLACVLELTGEKKQADHLISEAWRLLEINYPDDDTIMKAKLLVLAGDQDEAIEVLRHLVEMGYLTYFLRFDSVFDILYENEEYKSILAEGDARMAKQLERLHEMEARGELASIPKLKGPLGSSEIPPTAESLDELGI